MYWQKRFNRDNPNKKLEDTIIEICKEDKDYGYRRVLGELKKKFLIYEKCIKTMVIAEFVENCETEISVLVIIC